ncbi:632_t:CDS:2 [Ambispora gerdemannii]|uniref:632_t:CDS:1 n=1 Tax=Ambispora gerdemannii TaxID=144530 RepID=A0A9N8ZKR5_9GLOM|nr:632_t:CDS:2 [Ambispora gerdemannii]
MFSKLSRNGIGMYRMHFRSAENERALYKALQKQPEKQLVINVIDTSTNYGDGGSERLIGKVLEHPQKDTLTRSEIYIMSKFGYIQGTNMELYHQGEFKTIPDEQIVKYHPNCFHCIHPEFMRDQLDRSLRRIKTNHLNLLFIHNPEYYLLHEVKNGASRNVIEAAQNELLHRISETFEALEEEITKGRICAYGISSNSFSVKREDKHFLPYENLIESAKKAAKKVRGVNDHGFVGVQLPGNLLEQEGLKTTAKWAKENGLKVFINRPLNAFTEETGYRLASYPEPRYEESKQQVISFLETKIRGVDSPSRYAFDLINQLDSELPKIQSVFIWEQYTYTINAAIENLKISPEIYSAFINFLNAFDAEIRFKDSQQVRKYLIKECGFKELESDEKKKVEEFALEFLFSSGVVDTVLMGLTKQIYVDFVRDFLSKN